MRKLGHVHGTKQQRGRRTIIPALVGVLVRTDSCHSVHVIAGHTCEIDSPAWMRQPDRWDGYDVQVVA